METDNRNSRRERFRSTGSGRAFAGMILVIIGGALLGQQFGLDIPEWEKMWPVLLIAAGVFFGARRSFQPGGWMVMTLVGTAFLINDLYPDISMQNYIWPSAIIAFGLMMIFRPRRRRREWGFETTESSSSSDAINVNSVFGGSKKKIVTKEFKGGEINTVFGGNDLDFSQSDFEGTARLDVNVVFGGVKLIIPPHWKIQSEVDCVFGSVEDKRRDTTEVAENKTLILKGAVAFGSIEIKSY